METPEERILREFYRLPRREHVRLLIAVMRGLGLTGFARTTFLSRTGHAFMMLGVVALAGGMIFAFWSGRHRWGRLEVSTYPVDANVFLDGHGIEERPRFAITGRPGPHRLTVASPGYEPSDRTVWLTTERPQILHVTLEPYTDALRPGL